MPSTRSKSAKGKKKASAPSKPIKPVPAQPGPKDGNSRKYREETSSIVHFTPSDDGLGEETKETTVSVRTFFNDDGEPYLVSTTTILTKRVIVDIAHADGSDLPIDPIDVNPDILAMINNESNSDRIIFSRPSSPANDQPSVFTSIAGIRRYQAIHRVFRDMEAAAAAGPGPSTSLAAGHMVDQPVIKPFPANVVIVISDDEESE